MIVGTVFRRIVDVFLRVVSIQTKTGIMMHALVAIKERAQCFARSFRVSGVRQVAKCLQNVTLLERSLVVFPRFSNHHYFKNRVKINILICAFLRST
jgi:hypothetical protein